MNYSLTKIKTFRGMEGHGLNAVILQDTTPICFVLDDASGGEVQFDFTNPGQNGKSFEANRAFAKEREKAFGEFCLKWYEESGEMAKDKAQWEKWNKDSGGNVEHTVTAHDAMTHWVNHIADEFENKKRLDRAAKTKTLFRIKGDATTSWRTITKPYCPEIQAFLDKKYPGVVTEIYGVKAAA